MIKCLVDRGVTKTYSLDERGSCSHVNLQDMWRVEKERELLISSAEKPFSLSHAGEVQEKKS